MKRLLFCLVLCAAGCGDVGEDITVFTADGDGLIAITPVEPSPSPAAPSVSPTVYCELQEDNTTCNCWGPCGKEGLSAVVIRCNQLRDLAKIVIP